MIVKVGKNKEKIESEVYDIRTINTIGAEEIQFLVYLGTKKGFRYVKSSDTELIKG